MKAIQTGSIYSFLEKISALVGKWRQQQHAVEALDI